LVARAFPEFLNINTAKRLPFLIMRLPGMAGPIAIGRGERTDDPVVTGPADCRDKWSQ
jgi:hypothetical protein